MFAPLETRRCRAGREGGWLGRRRNYICRDCGVKFQVDTLNPLPEAERVCRPCQNARAERNGELKPGMEVVIYQYPMTKEKPEGRATLLAKIDDLGPGIERWQVHFVGESEVYERTIVRGLEVVK